MTYYQSGKTSDLPSAYKIEKMTEADLQKTIEKLAKRANVRLTRISEKYTAESGPALYLRKMAAVGNVKADASTGMAERFSRAKITSREQGIERVKALTSALSAKSSTITGIKDIERRRRESMGKTVGFALSKDEYGKLVELLAMKEDLHNMDSDSIIRIFKSEMKNRVFENFDDLKNWIKSTGTNEKVIGEEEYEQLLNKKEETGEQIHFEW